MAASADEVLFRIVGFRLLLLDDARAALGIGQAAVPVAARAEELAQIFCERGDFRRGVGVCRPGRGLVVVVRLFVGCRRLVVRCIRLGFGCRRLALRRTCFFFRCGFRIGCPVRSARCTRGRSLRVRRFPEGRVVDQAVFGKGAADCHIADTGRGATGAGALQQPEGAFAPAVFIPMPGKTRQILGVQEQMQRHDSQGGIGADHMEGVDERREGGVQHNL